MKYEATKVDCSGSAKEEGSITLRGKTYSSTQNKCESYVYEAGSIEVSNVLEPAPLAPVVDPVFANNTVDNIVAASNYISSNNLTSEEVYNTFGWSLGDSIPITLSTGEEIEMQIIGYNHDDKSDGSGKAGMTLQMKNCTVNYYAMNNSSTNAGGYPTSRLNTVTMPNIIMTLPQEWQDIIKHVNKLSTNGGGSNYTETITTSEMLFLLSYIELTGATNIANVNTEGSQYEYWQGKSKDDRIKYYDSNKDHILDSTTSWWLRSCGTNTGSFINVKTDGSSSSVTTASSTLRLSFAFCI